MDSWFAQGVGANNNSIPAIQACSKWRLAIDWADDAKVARPYY